MKFFTTLFLINLVASVLNLCYSQQWKIYGDSGTLYKGQKDFEAAATSFIKAKEALPPDSIFSITYLQFSKGIGESYLSLGENEKAIPFYEEAKASIVKLRSEFDAEYAAVCNNLGILYNNTGQYDSAQSLHFKAKEIREKLLGKNDPAYAQSCNNLGSLYIDMGRFGEAEPLLLEALAIREKIKPEKKSPVYAITSVALANLYRNIGQYEKAEPLYLTAKEIRGPDAAARASEIYAATCNILADLYFYMNLSNKAEALYLEAKDIRQKINKESYWYGQTCNNLANLYISLGRYKEAETLALEAKKIYEEFFPEGHVSRTIQLNGLGQLYSAMGNYKKAETYFLQAREAWKKTLGTEHPYYVTNTDEMARLYWQSGQTANAATFFTSAARSKYKSLNKIFSFTNEVEKGAYLKNITGTNDEYYSFCYKKISPAKGGEAFDLSLSARSLILSSTQQTRQTIYKTGDSSLLKTFDALTSLQNQLAKLYSIGQNAKPEVVKALEEKADVFEKALSRQSSVFKTMQAAPDWHSIQQKLSSTDAAIEFIEFQVYNGSQWTDSVMYMAAILKKNKAPVFVPLFEKKQLDNILFQKKSDAITAIYSSSSLYQIIWQPLEKYLAGVTKIYFAPVGELFNLSFAALPTTNRKVLSDKYRLVQLNSTATINKGPVDFIAVAETIQLYGGIYYDADSNAMRTASLPYHSRSEMSRSFTGELRGGKGFQYLPGTQEEVNGIKEQSIEAGAKASVFSGVSASEESLYALSGNSSPAVLHIATHGFFVPNPADAKDKMLQKFETSGQAFKQSANPLMRSALLFAGANNAWQGRFTSGIEDGIATAYEISTRLYLPNTKLVVLSACETALGDVQGSEGVYGLQRAFAMAGVPNLIMSLWKVPDVETASFMQAFYKALFTKQNIAEAFYDAQNSMKVKYRNDPYKWAAWVLIQ